VSSELYLADTSALVRYFRGQTSPEWEPVFEEGRAGICEPVRQEYLQAAGSRAEFYSADNLLREILPYYVVRDSAWVDTARLQRRLADLSQHQSASHVDLVVAVTAEHYGLTVLHADRDFEAIAKLTGQPTKRIDMP
jgi:hypothetical protein